MLEDAVISMLFNCSLFFFFCSLRLQILDKTRKSGSFEKIAWIYASIKNADGKWVSSVPILSRLDACSPFFLQPALEDSVMAYCKRRAFVRILNVQKN